MPLNFCLPACLNTAWVIAAIAGVVGRTDNCPHTSAHSAYQALRWGLFGTFALSALLQSGIVLSGLQGSPLEESKRRLAVPCLYLLLATNLVELIFAVYGTVIMHQVHAPCRLDARGHKIVALSWAKLAFTLIWLTSCYRIFPATLDDAQGWLDRVKWIFAQLRRVGVHVGRLPGQDDDNHSSHNGDDSEQEDWRREHARTEGHGEERRDSKTGKRIGPRKQGSKEDQLMHQLAVTFRMILGDIDLTVSDRHVALVLAAALQQMRRRRYVAKRLLPRDKWHEAAGIDEQDDQDPEAQRSDAEVARTMLAPSNVAAHMRPDLQPSQAADQYVTDGTERVPADVLQEALVYLEYSNASYYIEGPMDPEQERQAREQERRKRRRTCCFLPLPSSMQPAEARQPAEPRPAEEVDPGAALCKAQDFMSAEPHGRRSSDSTMQSRSSGGDAADPGTSSRQHAGGSKQQQQRRDWQHGEQRDRPWEGGSRCRVNSRHASSEADISGESASEGSSRAGRQVQDGAGEAHDTSKGATGKLDLEDPHKDMDIVYRKADNVVLGQLPYAIALDWKRKMVVLSCRGTSSIRDAVTDAIGQPIDLNLWLTDEAGEPPDEVKGLEPQAAHSGTLTAAAAVYKDLQRHRILQELLHGAPLPPLPSQTGSFQGKQRGSRAPQQAAASGSHVSGHERQHAASSESEAGAQDELASGSRNGAPYQLGDSATTPQSTMGWLTSFLPGIGKPAASLAKGSGQQTVDVSVSMPSDASHHRGVHPSDRECSSMDLEDTEHSSGSSSIGERHEAMAASMEEGQRMVAQLVRSSEPEDGGQPHSTPEAKAEEERQLGSLRARKLDCRGWGLVTTGHSLGGGVAALLALKLRASFPNVRCWAMCPPGGLLTAGLAHAMEPYCTSVALGKDGVPRASLHSMVRLMDDAVEGLARGRRCKARTILRNLHAGGRAKYQRPGEFYPLDCIPPEPLAALERYRKSREQTKNFLGKPTYPPGRIVYVRRLKDKDNQTSFDAVWIANETILAEGFLISSRMLKDHLVTAVEEGLSGALHTVRPEMSDAQSGSDEGCSSHESELGSYDSDSVQTGTLRLFLTGRFRQAAKQAQKVRKKHTRRAKEHAQTSSTGQMAHFSSSVEH